MKIRMFIQLSLITGVVILTITSGLQLVRAKSLQTNLLTPIQDKPTLYLQRVRSEIDFARSPFQITQSDTYTITDLGTLYGVPLRPYFVNDLGQVVGSFQSQFYNHCFFWENGLVYDLGTLGYDHCSVADINNSGQVAGTLSQEGGGKQSFSLGKW